MTKNSKIIDRREAYDRTNKHNGTFRKYSLEQLNRAREVAGLKPLSPRDEAEFLKGSERRHVRKK